MTSLAELMPMAAMMFKMLLVDLPIQLSLGTIPGP
ncbi:hypothetical protein C8K36_101761 [Rhodococcus sp. OK519]|nr:hypothetical protein C8K36_101761 [Rhodococcus sp. OK519]